MTRRLRPRRRPIALSGLTAVLVGGVLVASSLDVVVASSSSSSSRPSSPEDSSSSKRRTKKSAYACLPAEAVRERLQHGLDRPERVLTSVRIPGTATTKLNSDVKYAKSASVRFESFLSAEEEEGEGCEALCFHAADRDSEEEPNGRAAAPALPPVDPFVEFTGSMQIQHIPFDDIARREGESSSSSFDDAFLLTQIREPVQYARKFYGARRIFDAEAHFPEDITFEEWIDAAPWRTNQMTRMLGRENMDQRLIPDNDLIRSPPPGHSRDDTYMQEQNALGSDSEILARAWERLSARFAWFGLFHRLPESYELLSFTMCTSKDWKDRGVTANPRHSATGLEMLRFMRKRREGGLSPQKVGHVKLDEIHQKLLEINALDVILMNRAEELFDQRVKEMRDLKARGVKCKFMREVEVTCGKKNDALGSKDGISHFDLFY